MCFGTILKKCWSEPCSTLGVSVIGPRKRRLKGSVAEIQLMHSQDSLGLVEHDVRVQMELEEWQIIQGIIGFNKKFGFYFW